MKKKVLFRKNRGEKQINRRKTFRGIEILLEAKEDIKNKTIKNILREIKEDTYS